MTVAPEFPKTPFFSLRNVPLWAGLVMLEIALWLH
jgi:hypothetical protein